MTKNAELPMAARNRRGMARPYATTTRKNSPRGYQTVLPMGEHDEVPRRMQTTQVTSANTWNDAARIAAHRALTPAQRLRLTIEASRAALRFANGPRRVER